MKKITNCLKEIKPFFEESEMNFFNSFARCFDSARMNLVEIICAGWERASETFHQYEKWSSKSNVFQTNEINDKSGESAPLAKIFSQMSAVLIRNIYNISVATKLHKIDEYAPGEFVRETSVGMIDFADLVGQTLFNCHYNLLDGFQYLVTEFHTPQFDSDLQSLEYLPTVFNKKLKSQLPDNIDPLGIFAPLEMLNSFNSTKEKTLPIWKSEIRCLIVYANVTYLQENMVLKLIKLVESKFNISLGTQKKV